MGPKHPPLFYVLVTAMGSIGLALVVGLRETAVPDAPGWWLAVILCSSPGLALGWINGSRDRDPSRSTRSPAGSGIVLGAAALSIPFGIYVRGAVGDDRALWFLGLVVLALILGLLGGLINRAARHDA